MIMIRYFFVFLLPLFLGIPSFAHDPLKEADLLKRMDTLLRRTNHIEKISKLEKEIQGLKNELQQFKRGWTCVAYCSRRSNGSWGDYIVWGVQSTASHRKLAFQMIKKLCEHDDLLMFPNFKYNGKLMNRDISVRLKWKEANSSRHATVRNSCARNPLPEK